MFELDNFPRWFVSEIMSSKVHSLLTSRFTLAVSHVTTIYSYLHTPE